MEPEGEDCAVPGVVPRAGGSAHWPQWGSWHPVKSHWPLHAASINAWHLCIQNHYPVLFIKKCKVTCSPQRSKTCRPWFMSSYRSEGRWRGEKKSWRNYQPLRNVNNNPGLFFFFNRNINRGPKAATLAHSSDIANSIGNAFEAAASPQLPSKQAMLEQHKRGTCWPKWWLCAATGTAHKAVTAPCSRCRWACPHACTHCRRKGDISWAEKRHSNGQKVPEGSWTKTRWWSQGQQYKELWMVWFSKLLRG